MNTRQVDEKLCSGNLQRGDQQGTKFDKFGIKIKLLEEELREKKSDLYIKSA